MGFAKGAVASAVAGIILGGVLAFGINTYVSDTTIPVVEQPAADQSLLGQVEYGAR